MAQYARGFRDPGLEYPTRNQVHTDGNTMNVSKRAQSSNKQWHPTVLYLLALVLAEIAGLAMLRHLPSVRG